MEDCFVAQVAPSPKISGDNRNDEKGEWLIEKPCHLSLYIGWEDCNNIWFYFLFAGHNLTIVKTRIMVSNYIKI